MTSAQTEQLLPVPGPPPDSARTARRQSTGHDRVTRFLSKLVLEGVIRHCTGSPLLAPLIERQTRPTGLPGSGTFPRQLSFCEDHGGSHAAPAAILAFLTACDRGNSPSNVAAAGGTETPKTTVLEAGADVLQSKAPLRELDAYLDGFHFKDGDMRARSS
jgi:hypothetical protein